MKLSLLSLFNVLHIIFFIVFCLDFLSILLLVISKRISVTVITPMANLNRKYTKARLTTTLMYKTLPKKWSILSK